MMRATEIEFRQRFWFIGGIFWLGFSCYAFDHQNAGLALASLVWRRHFNPDLTAAGSAVPLHVVFAFAALLCVLCGLLGGVLLAAGIGFLASRTGWLVMTFGLLFFYYRLIFREEAALKASQGQSFLDYCATVPRFLPALRARVPSSGAKPRWGQAFAGEMFIWGFAAATVAFAATLSLEIFWLVIAVSFAAYFAYWLASSHMAKRKTTTS